MLHFYLRKTTPYAFVKIQNHPLGKSHLLEVLSVPKSYIDHSRRGEKGYGESKLINFALEKSTILNKHEGFIKITGRHKIFNINIIRNFILEKSNNKTDYDFITDFNHRNHSSISTYFFYSKITFYKQFMLNIFEDIDDRQYRYIEQAIYNRLQLAASNGSKIGCLPFFVLTNAKSTQSGNRIHSRMSILKSLLRQTIKPLPRMIEF